MIDDESTSLFIPELKSAEHEQKKLRYLRCMNRILDLHIYSKFFFSKTS